MPRKDNINEILPLPRYIHTIYLGFKSRVTQKVVHTQRALTSQSDVSILRLFEAFLESAPQLVLQLYIMVARQSFGWFACKDLEDIGLTSMSSPSLNTINLEQL